MDTNRRPAIIIGDGFTTNDLHTLDDCTTAFMMLNEGIITIEGQLSDPEFVASRTPKWQADARTALRFKKVGLQIVQTRRSEIKATFAVDWARRFVDLVRTDYPDIFNKVQATLAA